MVLSARLMKALDLTFCRGVISRAQLASSGATQYHALLQGSAIDKVLCLWAVAPHFAQVSEFLPCAHTQEIADLVRFGRKSLSVCLLL